LLAGKNKKVLAIVASGGGYAEGSSLSALDHEVPYLRFIFGFMGLTDVRFVQAGGTGAILQGRESAEEFLSPISRKLPQPSESGLVYDFMKTPHQIEPSNGHA
jgi:FMN-dependent NADH-azoreductase